MIDFYDYWKKHYPSAGRVQARKMWRMSVEAVAISTDYKKKEDMRDIIRTNDFYFSEYVSLAPLNSTSQAADGVYNIPCPVPCAKAKGNNPMYIDNDKHIESGKLNYFVERICSISCLKMDALRSTFHLDDDAQPQSPSELVKRIQDGKFVLNKETEDKKFHNPTYYIKWRDPAVLADKDGYDAAMKSLGAASTKARDAVMSGADYLATVQTLDAWTPTGVAS